MLWSTMYIHSDIKTASFTLKLISHCALFILLQALWSVHSKKNLPDNDFLFNPYYSASSKNKIFRNFLEFLIYSPLWVICKKNLIFVKTSKNIFLDPQTTNLNKTRRGHFWSSGPQKTHTKLTFPYKMVSLLRYFVILLFLCCT